jgi:hypothetical protein
MEKHNIIISVSCLLLFISMCTIANGSETDYVTLGSVRSINDVLLPDTSEVITSNEVVTVPEPETNSLSLSSEILIDNKTNPQVAAAYKQTNPDIAFSGSNYLAVWEDDRTGWQQDNNIYATLLTVDGTFSSNIAISNDIQSIVRSGPAVAYGGGLYLVVWGEYRLNTGWDIYAARVNASGTVLDAYGIAVCNEVANQVSPSVAFDGTNFMVVWGDWRNADEDIYACRVSTSGIVLDPNGIRLTSAFDWQRYPAIAFDGTNYLVVWEDRRNGVYDIYGTRVSANGSVLDADGIVINNWIYVQNEVSLAFNGNDYLVIWTDFRNGNFNTDIFGTAVSKSGVVQNPEGIQFTNDAGMEYSPAIKANGSNYFIACCTSNGIEGFTVSEGLPPESKTQNVSSLFNITSDPGELPAVSYDGVNNMVVWSEYKAEPMIVDIYYKSDFDIVGARVSESGNVYDPNGILLSKSPYAQRDIQVCSDGNNYLTVWSDYRDGNWDIYGCLLNASGQRITSADIQISLSNKEEYAPVVSFDGSNYLVAWISYDSNSPNIYKIQGMRISNDGELQDIDPIDVYVSNNPVQTPTIAFDGANYLIAWSSVVNYGWDILGARINVDGEVLDNPCLNIITASNTQIMPAMVFDGENYLMVYQNNPLSKIGSSVSAVKVSKDGAVAYGPFVVSSVYSSPSHYCFPSVAFDGVNYLAVWQDIVNGENNIFSALISTSGTILKKSTICDLPGEQVYPTVAFNGFNYVVTWSDNRPQLYDWNIYSREVSTTGDPLWETVITSTSGQQLFPTIAKGGHLQTMICYQGFCSQSSLNTQRAWARIAVDAPPAAPSQPTVSLIAPPLSAKITWLGNIEPDVASYNIYRSVGIEGNWVLLGTVLSSDYSISGPRKTYVYYDQTIEQGVTYYYCLKASDMAGSWSGYSASANVSVPLLLSTNEDATGYNGGVKFAYNREFGLVYSSGPLRMLSGEDSIRYAKSADAASWTGGNAIMPGKYPALTIDYLKALPTDAVPSPLGTRYRHVASNVYGNSEEVASIGWTGTSRDNINANINWNDYFYEQVGGYYKPGYMSPPAIAKDANHRIHLAYEKGEIWRDANNVIHWWWALVYQKMDYTWAPLESDVVAYAEGTSGGQINKSPSLVLDAYSKPHLIWSQDGAVNYSVKQNGAWSAPRTMNTSGRPGKEPFIEINGTTIKTVWVEDEANGLGEIWYQIKDVGTNPDVWPGYPMQESFTTTQDSRWPQLAGGHVIWSEQVGGNNWEIYLDGQNISNTPASSRFSQSCFRQTTSASYVYSAWTEGDAAPYQIKFSTLTVPATPTYTIDIAQEEDSPYTIYRDGDTTYPSGYSVDYAFKELSYSIGDLDTTAPFDLEIIGYHESSEEWKQMVEIDGKWKHLMKVMAHEPETLKVRIPPAFLKDGKVDIKIIKKSGDYAAICKLGLYQYEQENVSPSKSGGAQFSSNEDVQRMQYPFLLKQNAPNPFTGSTTISYQLTANSQVNLSIYNITGQLVKTLTNELKGAGSHSITWDGRDNNGTKVSGGVYVYKLKAGEKEATQRMVLLK